MTTATKKNRVCENCGRKGAQYEAAAGSWVCSKYCDEELFEDEQDEDTEITMPATKTQPRTEVIETQLVHELLRVVDRARLALLTPVVPDELPEMRWAAQAELWAAKEALQEARLRRIAAGK